MRPRMIRAIPRPLGDAEIWDVGGEHHVLVLPGVETRSVSAHGVRDRKQYDWLTSEIEKVAKASGLWLETVPGIDTWMVVVRTADVPAFLQACADHFGGTQAM